MNEPVELESYWNDRYGRASSTELGWYQEEPATLNMVRSVAAADDAIVDVGAGASTLVDHLLQDGMLDITVLDVAEASLDLVRDRLGERSDGVEFVVSDIAEWRPERRYDVWHDRAVFHFMTTPQSRAGYVESLDRVLADDGRVIIAAFAVDGPDTCAGLPTQRYTAESLALEFAGVLIAESCELLASDVVGDQRPYVACVFARDSKSPVLEGDGNV
jgi:ubiquinone/menaquinone biosynthesis C-methylase UbiE